MNRPFPMGGSSCSAAWAKEKARAEASRARARRDALVLIVDLPLMDRLALPNTRRTDAHYGGNALENRGRLSPWCHFPTNFCWRLISPSQNTTDVRFYRALNIRL